jgi:peptidoglycan-associated lipoprotein
MLRHLPAVALMIAAVGAMTVTGCSKRPVGLAGWTAPAPTAATGADGSRALSGGAGGGGSDSSNTPGTSRTPGAQTSAAPPDAAEDRRGTGRPQVKEFAPVSDLVDVYFQFDRYEIQPAQAKVLDSNARWLRSNRDLVLIEGHCDERGTTEYNLALGERRAASTLNYLVSQGVAANRITIVSYGKERPQCSERTESCWQKNRRAHFLVKRQ